MSRTTAKPVETWGLAELLAAFCQAAQDAGEANSALQAAEDNLIAGRLPVAVEEGSRR